MFKKSRFRIIAVVMLSLILFLFGTLIIIYGSSYFEISERNYGMLENYVNTYSLTGPPKENEKREIKESSETPPKDVPPREEKDPKNGKDKDKHLYDSADFYSVAKGHDGSIIDVSNSRSNLLTEEEIVEFAGKIESEEKSYGRIGNYVYMVRAKEKYTLIAFMDNSVLTENMKTLLRQTLFYGLISIGVIFVISYFLSIRIVKPLEENYEKQKQFISDAGHELKTPISVISANAEILERECGDNVWLSNILYENERMGLLIKQLLELSRTEDAVPTKEPLNLSRIVLGEALPFESVAFEKNHELIYDVDDEIYVSGNIAQMKQLTAILLDNAISHSVPEKEIVLSLKEKRKHACLSVVNYGQEITKEQKTEIFERFYRLDKVRNSSDNHYGLGLPIAKAIVSAHKGKIDVHCYEGKVEFAVVIPII